MRRLLALLLLLGAMTAPCYGAEPMETPGLDELWSRAEDYGIDREADLQSGLKGLAAEGAGELGSVLKIGAAAVLKLMAVVLVCSLADGAGVGQEGLRAAELAGALAITALTVSDMDGMLGLGRATLEEMSSFSKALLPVMAVLTAATGSPAGAAVRQGATVLFSQLLLSAMDRVLIPLLYAYVAVCCASAALDARGLDRLAGLLKNAVAFLLTGLLLGFVAYLTASGAIAGGADASAVKAAKMAITRVIPVVGGILADASETVLAGAAALRGTVGAVGMLAVLSICLSPFLRLGVHYLAYKAAAALCALVAQPGLCGLIDAIGGAFGMILGMTGAAALVLLISLVSALTAVIP